jgi:transcriptional regulator with XRE-family HTH domain
MTGSARQPSFGRWLRKSRELRGLSLEEVVEETRLAPRIVAALEVDDTSSMPDRAYALGVARTVANAVGLDPEDAALRYEEWLLSQPPGTLPPPPIEQTGGAKALHAVKAAASLPARISRDPFVWTVLILTLVACVAILTRR